MTHSTKLQANQVITVKFYFQDLMPYLESSEGDQIYVLKAGDKRGVTKKMKKTKKYVISKLSPNDNLLRLFRRDQSPILKSSITREIRSIAKSDSKKAKMTEKELELERKMDRNGQNKYLK